MTNATTYTTAQALAIYCECNAATHIQLAKKLGHTWWLVTMPIRELEPYDVLYMDKNKEGETRYRFRPSNTVFSQLMNKFGAEELASEEYVNEQLAVMREECKGKRVNRGLVIEKLCAGKQFNLAHAMTSGSWMYEPDYTDKDGRAIQVKGYDGGVDITDLRKAHDANNLDVGAAWYMLRELYGLDC